MRSRNASSIDLKKKLTDAINICCCWKNDVGLWTATTILNDLKKINIYMVVSSSEASLLSKTYVYILLYLNFKVNFYFILC